MEYILQFARILGFCLAGEALHHFLPLPIPASIYGLIPWPWKPASSSWDR